MYKEIVHAKSTVIESEDNVTVATEVVRARGRRQSKELIADSYGNLKEAASSVRRAAHLHSVLYYAESSTAVVAFATALKLGINAYVSKDPVQLFVAADLVAFGALLKRHSPDAYKSKVVSKSQKVALDVFRK